MKKLKRLKLAGFQQLSASEEAQTLGGNNSNSLAGIIVDNGDGTLIYSYDGDSSKINLNNNDGMSAIGGISRGSSDFPGGSFDMFNAFSGGSGGYSGGYSGFPITPSPYGQGNYGGSGGYNFGNSGGQSGYVYPIYSGGSYGIGYSGGNWGISGYGGSGGYGAGYSGGDWGISGYGGSSGYGVGYSGGNWGISGYGGSSGYGGGVKYYF